MNIFRKVMVNSNSQPGPLPLSLRPCVPQLAVHSGGFSLYASRSEFQKEICTSPIPYLRITPSYKNPVFSKWYQVTQSKKCIVSQALGPPIQSSTRSSSFHLNVFREEREREMEREIMISCPTDLCTHWLILACALTEIKPASVMRGAML